MIGLFDSGHGGLTIYKALQEAFPDQTFLYLGDHRNAPYGDRPSREILALTRDGVDRLFQSGCRLVILACNTATAVALRELQTRWLPESGWQGRNVLGIIAPTVEAATQTPWAATCPQYPQKYNSDLIGVFATSRTIASQVYDIEIKKRCPLVRVVSEACPELAGSLEAGASQAVLDDMVAHHVARLLAKTDGAPPDRAILGCTHYALISDLFRRHLPPRTRLLPQPLAVTRSLEHYLERHPRYRHTGGGDTLPPTPTRLMTTGDLATVNASIRRLLNGDGLPAFEALS